jgi:hypothetical protein
VSEAAAPEVVDDEEGHRFVVRQDGAEAELVYEARPGRLTLIHTEVPPELGGHGLATRLTEAALARARRTGETIVPWCPFARRYLAQHPERHADVSVDWHDTPPAEP